ncbi:hypothetical protein AQUCO_05200015v1 [Aquilegia coerulea]|uniref:Uncharacterized protein n=1 Tax=Aquilegia coerulea TaxID=218851 RepID=A0A2G5CIL4_AQUCA|nr:hypothetical protein AQUCO_05200015v1 [Aquilegia coerulea]
MNILEKLEAAGKKKENGDTLFKDGKYAKASKQYKKAAKCIDYNTLFSEEEIQESKALKVSCDISNAACKLKLKDYKQAEKLCTKVIKIEAQNVVAYHIRAQAYIQQSVLNPADSDIRNALRIDPNNKYAILFFAILAWTSCSLSCN